MLSDILDMFLEFFNFLPRPAAKEYPVKEMTWEEFSGQYCARQVNTPEGLLATLQGQRERFQPTGWILLECQVMDSSRFNELVILPYGPNNSLKEIPTQPFSPRGLASDMSIVIGVLPVENLP